MPFRPTARMVLISGSCQAVERTHDASFGKSVAFGYRDEAPSPTGTGTRMLSGTPTRTNKKRTPLQS